LAYIYRNTEEAICAPAVCDVWFVAWGSQRSDLWICGI